MIGNENNRKQKNSRGILFDLIPKTANTNIRRQSIGPINPSFDNESKSTIHHSNSRFVENSCNDAEDVDLLLKIESDATFL